MTVTTLVITGTYLISTVGAVLVAVHYMHTFPRSPKVLTILSSLFNTFAAWLLFYSAISMIFGPLSAPQADLLRPHFLPWIVLPHRQ
jgi:hypothetical protein